MKEVYAKFNIEENLIEILGRTIALQPTDDYLDQPAFETLDRIKNYQSNKLTAENGLFLYPTYGFSGLPEACLRLGSDSGSASMMNTEVDQIIYREDGKVNGIRSGD